MAPVPTFPSGGNSTTTGGEESSDLDNAKPLLFLVVALLFGFVGYKIYRTYRHRREQYMMRLRSVQADQVLGDMQMVPSDDPDAELL